jgi:hypothetical protein
MGLANLLYKAIFKPVTKVVSKYGDDILNIMTGGATGRAEEARKDLAQAKVEAQLLDESIAKDWSQTQRQAAIAAQQANMEADAIGEQARAASIDQFQAESAALADSGLSGISEGSPYMAAQASLSETDRALRNWFSKSSESISMTGENTAMSIENARFRKKQGENNLTKLNKNISKMEDNMPGGLDILGGFLKTAASVYSLGSTAIGGLKLAGLDLGNFGLGAMNNGQMPGMLGMMRMGGEKMYTALTEDDTFFKEFDPPKMDIWGSDARKFGGKAQDLWGGFKDSFGQTQFKGLALPTMSPMATPEMLQVGGMMPMNNQAYPQMPSYLQSPLTARFDPRFNL